jgi:hypothetical protein
MLLRTCPDSHIGVRRFEEPEPVLLLACLVLVPFFTVFAYRGWTREFRGKPFSWRRLIGLISLLAAFCSWVPLAIFLFLLLFHRSWAEFFPTYLGLRLQCFVRCWALLALSLKGSSRILTLVAGLFLAHTLMFVYGIVDVIKR